jgi:hypothetical protein
MRNLIVILLYACLCISCDAQDKQVIKKENLIGSQWVSGFSEFPECYKITFKKNNHYEDFNCEVQYTFSGTYEVKNDTIYMTEIDLISDLPGTTETEIKSISKMILTDKGLTSIYYKRRTGVGWDEKWIGNPEIFFKKINLAVQSIYLWLIYGEV